MRDIGVGFLQSKDRKKYFDHQSQYRRHFWELGIFESTCIVFALLKEFWLWQMDYYLAVFGRHTKNYWIEQKSKLKMKTDA